MKLEIVTLPEFEEWLTNIKDGVTRRRLGRRLERAENGNLGDVEPVGEGVSEMREHFGQGWRMYFVRHGQTIIIMLGGGDKSTQQRDITKAIALSKTLED
ncbi:MAG: type II toxin-antitoxin system RelE/ParE family toxin [Acinetobacter sp.]|nr:MAG: type II toxin-antitoxin system RelE/ParE family toxin [Acinetobacter sp.]